MWPAQLSISSSWKAVDARRIVAVDTGCSPSEIDADWTVRVVIATVSESAGEGSSGLVWSRRTLWDAASNGAAADAEAVSVGELDSLLKAGDEVFLHRGKNFRRYAVAENDDAAAGKAGAAACESAASPSRSPAPVTSATARSVRIVIMDEKKKNDAATEQQQREGQEAQSPQQHGDNDDEDDAVDGDGESTATVQREGASHTKRAKEFSQAVAFEFVSDVIGSCLAGKR